MSVASNTYAVGTLCWGKCADKGKFNYKCSRHYSLIFSFFPPSETVTNNNNFLLAVSSRSHACVPIFTHSPIYSPVCHPTPAPIYHPSTHPLVCHPTTHIPACHPSIHPHICHRPVYAPIWHPPIHPLVCASRPSNPSTIHPYHPSICYLPIHLPICQPYIHPSTHLPIMGARLQAIGRIQSQVRLSLRGQLLASRSGGTTAARVDLVEERLEEVCLRERCLALRAPACAIGLCHSCHQTNPPAVG